MALNKQKVTVSCFCWPQGLYTITLSASEFVECGKDFCVLLGVIKHQSAIFPISEMLVLLFPCKQAY